MTAETPFRDDLDARLLAALKEDLGPGDLTSQAIVPAHTVGTAVIRAKQQGCLCGVPVAERVFALIDNALACARQLDDGASLQPGDEVLRIRGPLRSIFAGERLALNFLQRLSGIATLTRRFVQALPPGASLSVCDTRKTTPLWRDLERLAVRAGGGTNHRSGLWDMVMIKDTHAAAAGGLAQALDRVRYAAVDVPVAAEARTLEEAREAARAGVDLLMLDNMTHDAIAQVVREVGKACTIEVTGGITPDRLPELARLGVHRVSVGALTHSAPALDLSLTLG
jgi:nicotinate-nucleotide pyrophosphorylase (carboxylating)